MTPLRPVSSSSGSWPTRIGRLAARRGHGRAQVVAVEIRDHAGRELQLDRDRVRLALRGCPRGSIPTAPAAFACAAFVTNGQRPRSASAIFPSSECAGSVPCVEVEIGSRRRRGGARPACRRCRRSSRRRRASGSASPRRPARAPRRRRWNGIPWRMRGRARGGHVERRREHVGVRDGGDGDRVRSGSGRARRAGAEVVAVVAGRDHGHDARGGDVVDRLDQRVVRRLDLRAAAGEVDHVHAVGDRRLEGGDDLRRVRDVADRRRHGEDAVVAEPRLRRDAAEPGHLGVVRPGRGRRAGVAGGDPGDVRAVEGRVGIERQLSRLARSSGRGRPSRRSPSASCTSCRPSGSRPGTRSPRVEERVRLVDAVVDDADLHPGAVRAGRSAASTSAPITPVEVSSAIVYWTLG